MKCPKCGYLGFEPVDRCRNCGYDFSLVPAIDRELPLRPDDSGKDLADLALDDFDAPLAEARHGDLDLDRLIGAPDTATPPAPVPAAFNPDADGRLPLFDDGLPDDAPLIQSAGPPRAPLAVRRASPEIPRARTRTTRNVTRDAPAPSLELEPPLAPEDDRRARQSVYVRPDEVDGGEADAARGGSRLAAFVLDLALLSAVNAGVVYLTLQIAGVRPEEADVLPLGPLVAFLALLNGGYLVALTAAAGQTMGKMATGIRVVADGNGRLDTGRATLRAAASLLSIVTLGAGFLPALLRPGGRTFHDRIAGTRVVRD